MDGFVNFLASANGRIARVVAGIVLVILGFIIGDTAGIIVAIVGLIPLLAGLFDVCLFAPLAGMPLQGTKIRGEE